MRRCARSLWRYTKHAYNSMNVEPVILLFTLALTVNGTALQLFIYWARCMELSEEYDPAMRNATFENRSEYCQSKATDVNATAKQVAYADARLSERVMT